MYIYLFVYFFEILEVYYNIMVLRLVETKAMASISSRAEAIKKHNNGNHLVRIAVACVLIFRTLVSVATDQ